MSKQTVEFVAYGETLTIISQGPIWIAPSTGEQFASAKDAARAEVGELVSAGGDNPEDCESEIDAIVAKIRY